MDNMMFQVFIVVRNGTIKFVTNKEMNALRYCYLNNDCAIYVYGQNDAEGMLYDIILKGEVIGI